MSNAVITNGKWSIVGGKLLNDSGGTDCCCGGCPATYPTCATSFACDLVCVLTNGGVPGGVGGTAGQCCDPTLGPGTMTLTKSTTLSYTAGGTAEPDAAEQSGTEDFWISPVYDPPDDPGRGITGPPIPGLCDAQIQLYCCDTRTSLAVPNSYNTSNTLVPLISGVYWVIAVSSTQGVVWFGVPKTTTCPPTGSYPYLGNNTWNPSIVGGNGPFGCTPSGTPTCVLS